MEYKIPQGLPDLARFPELSLAQWESNWHMKCNSMKVTRQLQENQIQFEYLLHQQKLEQLQSAKYLGITITDNLDWGKHVSEISSKATKTMGFLRHNLALAPWAQHTKVTNVSYKTLQFIIYKIGKDTYKLLKLAVQSSFIIKYM